MFRRKSKRIQYWRLCQHEIKVALLTALIFLFGNQGSAQTAPEQRFHNAEISFQLSKWTDALKGFISVYEDSLLGPSAASAYRISQCYENLGKRTEATHYAAATVSLDSNEDAYLIHYANLLELSYDYPSAWKLRLKLIEKQPRYISRYDKALQNAVNRNQIQDYFIITQKWETQFGLSPMLTEKIATGYLAINDTASAIHIYEKLCKKYDNRPDMVQYFENFKQHLGMKTPLNATQNVLDQALASMKAGAYQDAYTQVTRCHEADLGNFQLLELQFLLAYLLNENDDLKDGLNQFYLLYPFLNEHIEFAEFVLKIQESNSLPKVEMPKVPTETWRFIEADLQIKKGDKKQGMKLLKILEKEAPNNPNIPLYNIHQILYPNIK